MDGIITKTEVTTLNSIITNETYKALKTQCVHTTNTENISNILQEEVDSEGSMETDSLVEFQATNRNDNINNSKNIKDNDEDNNLTKNDHPHSISNNDV